MNESHVANTNITEQLNSLWLSLKNNALKQDVCVKCEQTFTYAHTKGGRRKYCDSCRSTVVKEQKTQAARRYSHTTRGKMVLAKAKAKHRQTLEAKAEHARSMAEYGRTPEGQMAVARTRAKYCSSPKGKETYARSMAEYSLTPNGKAARARAGARYYSSPKGKAHLAKMVAQRRKKSTNPASYAARAELLHVLQEPCAECRAPYKITHQIDHILALCLGGTDDWSNLQPLCLSCHRKKTKEDIRKAVVRSRVVT